VSGLDNGSERWTFFSEMLSQGLRGDAIAWTAAISACQQGRQWQLALHLVHVAGGNVDSIMYTASMDACWKAGRHDIAKKLLQEMGSVGVEGNVITCNTAVSGLAFGMWPSALDLLSQAAAAGLESDSVTFNAVIDNFETRKAGRWPWALHILGSMRHSLSETDVFSFSSAVGCCEGSAQWREALALEMEMNQANVPVNAFVLSAAVSACEKATCWRQALSLVLDSPQRQQYKQHQDGSVADWAVAYNAALRALAAAAFPGVVVPAVFKAMRDQTVEPDMLTFEAGAVALSTSQGDADDSELRLRRLHLVSLLDACGARAVRSN